MLASSAVSAARSVGSYDRLDPAGLDPREVQQGVDQLQEPQAAAVGRLQPLALPGGQGLGRVGERVLDRAEHQGQRRAELVRDVGEEGRLRPVELRQGLGPLLLLLVGPGVGDGGADLAGDQLEEPAVLLVEPQPRADAGHEESRRLVGPGRRDGQHDGRWSGGRTTAPAARPRSGPPGRGPPGGSPPPSPRRAASRRRPRRPGARPGG